jgi:hypothetical protein
VSPEEEHIRHCPWDENCVKGMAEQFRANLLKPVDKFDDVRFTKGKENQMKKLWAELSHANQKTLRVAR